MTGESAEALASLAACAAEATGFRADAVSPDAIGRVFAAQTALGLNAADIAESARRNDPAIVQALRDAVTVGETFFFRHAEQFDFIVDQILRNRPRGVAGLRAWSAGCATGEEAYTLAACLMAALEPDETDLPSVLGTDLIERNLRFAAIGNYRPWSIRISAPLRHPLFRPTAPGINSVTNRLRAITRFARHNLLDGPPSDAGPFDLIVCRNVLVYFDPERAQSACRRLSSALAPGGLLLFGTTDLLEPPPFLEQIGPSELQAFRLRPREGPRSIVPRPRLERMLTPHDLPRNRMAMPAAPKPVAVVTPIELHLAALGQIDRGADDAADQLLRQVESHHPGYVPGLLERALLLHRTGDSRGTHRLMLEVLRLVDGRPADEPIDGPQQLPVEYYRHSAESFLELAS